MNLSKGDVIIIRNKNQSYTSKTRPAIVYQNGLCGNQLHSVTVILLSSSIVNNAEPFRVNILPCDQNGLTTLSQAMADKITTILKSDIGEKVGTVDVATILKIDDALRLWLEI